MIIWPGTALRSLGMLIFLNNHTKLATSYESQMVELLCMDLGLELGVRFLIGGSMSTKLVRDASSYIGMPCRVGKWREINGGSMPLDCVVVVGVTDNGEVIGVLMTGVIGLIYILIESHPGDLWDMTLLMIVYEARCGIGRGRRQAGNVCFRLLIEHWIEEAGR
jgi:hypothetical protein